MMKKSFCIIILLILILSGCNSKYDISTASEFKVIYPTDNTVNGYRNPESKTSSSSEPIYYANLKTKKYHLSTCTYAKKSAKENLFITKDKNLIIEYGCTPCLKCNP